jgi:glycosyltransferase involved in cell wall biosynthesis
MSVFHEYALEPLQPLTAIPRPASTVEVMVLSYNSANWIEKCLRSIFCQVEVPDVSVIIHDDGSTDDSCHLIREMSRDAPFPVTLFTRTKNSLPDGADFFFELLSSAKSEFIAILDGDDYWLNQNILGEQHRAMFQNPMASLSFHDYAVFQDSFQKNSTVFPSKLSLATLNCFPTFAAENPIGTSTVMLRASSIGKVNMLGRQDLPFQDFALWSQIAALGEYLYVPGLTTAYRRHEASLSSAKSWRRLAGESRRVNTWLRPRLASLGRSSVAWSILNSFPARLLWLIASRALRRRVDLDLLPGFLENRHK